MIFQSLLLGKQQDLKFFVEGSGGFIATLVLWGGKYKETTRNVVLVSSMLDLPRTQ